MKVSYSILTHNETDSLQELLDFLIRWKDDEDEIVILDDYSDNKKTIELLDVYIPVNDMVFEQRHLFDDFAGQKNHLKRMCSGEYIVNIDADEIPHRRFIRNLKAVLEANPTVDLYYIPRVNTVEGITQEHIQKWGWRLNDSGWINWPDWQSRAWKNRPNIIWERPVHEMLVGFKEYTYFPADEEFAFYHPKDIKKQEQQNILYGDIINENKL